MASGKRKEQFDHVNNADTPQPQVPGSITAAKRNEDRTKYHLNSPFCDEILSEQATPNFTLPSGLPKYNGFKDPQEHVVMFNHHMLLYNLSDAMRTKVFVTTLEDVAVYWFSRLPSASIQSYRDLCEKFIEYFAFGKRTERQLRYLPKVVQRPGETLKNFMKRFNTVMLEINPGMRVALGVDYICHVLAQCVTNRLFAQALAEHRPESYQQMMRLAEICMQFEENELAGLD